MLTQQRHEIILKLLKEKGSITVTEVRDLLDTSESTVRRDITALDKEGKLEKVFGGAVEAGQKVTAHEYTVAQKNELNCDAKRKIAEYAASLIEPEASFRSARSFWKQMWQNIRQERNVNTAET